MWQEAESSGKENWSIDTICQPRVLEWRVVTDLAVIASLILTILHLKKRKFLLSAPSTFTQTGLAQRKCQKRGDKGQAVQNQQLVKFFQVSLQSWDVLTGPKIIPQWISKDIKCDSLFFFFLDAKEHCKLLRTLLSFAEVPPQVFAKRRGEKGLSHPQQPFPPPRSHHARCDRWCQMCRRCPVHNDKHSKSVCFAITFSSSFHLQERGWIDFYFACLHWFFLLWKISKNTKNKIRKSSIKSTHYPDSAALGFDHIAFIYPSPSPAQYCTANTRPRVILSLGISFCIS